MRVRAEEQPLLGQSLVLQHRTEGLYRARESRHACRKPQPRQRAGLWWLRATSAIISTDSNSAMEAGGETSLLRHDLRRRC